MTNIPDEKEIIKGLIGQIRDLYVDIIKLRAEDRSKYKEMANRLDTLEKDRSNRTKKRRRIAKTKKSKASKNTGSTGAPKKEPSKEDNKKSPAAVDGTPRSVKKEEEGENQEKEQ